MADDYKADINSTGRISPGGSVTGSFESSYDSDWIRITLQAGSTYLFSLSGARTGEGTLPQSSFGSLSMMDSKGGYASGGISVNAGGDPTYQFTPKISGDYFINLQGSFQTGTYTLKAATPAADDYRDDARTTGLLQDGVGASGVFERADDVDWFKFHADAGQILTFTGDGLLASAYGDRMVYAADGTMVTSLGSSPFIATKSGDYYLGVRAGGSIGAYSVTMRNVVDDYSSDNSHAGQLNAGAAASGALDYYGDADRFQLNMEAGKFYTLTLTSAGGTGNYVSMGVRALDGSSSSATLVNGVYTLHYMASTTGNYAIDVSGYNVGRFSYTLSASGPEADDHGNTRDTATAIALDVSTAGRLQAGSDLDVFKIDLKAGVTYRFDVDADVIATNINSYLYDSTGSQVASQYDSKFYTFTPTKDGTYYATESSYYAGANPVAYTITASTAADDFGATAASAGRLYVSGAQKGMLEEGGGDRDWFAISLQAGGYYWFSLEGAKEGSGTLGSGYGSTALNLLDASGKVLATANGVSSGTSSVMPFTATSAGTYYVEVAASHASGSYTVKAQYGVKDDYGDDAAHATALALGTQVKGALELTSDKDAFKVSAVAGTTYQVDFTLPKGGASWQYLAGVSVTDASQGYVGARVTYDGNKAIILFEAAKDGDYYLSVAGSWQTSTNTPYTLAVNAIAVDDYSANTSTTAHIEPGAPLHGAINFSDDRDWIKVHLDAGRTYVFDLQGSRTGGGTLDTSSTGSYITAGMALMNANGSTVIGSTFPATNNGVDPRIQYVATSSGDYYLAVYGNGKSTGTYTVQEVQTNLDTVGPHLLTSSVAAGATGVPLKTSIVLNFDETIMLGSGLTLTDANGKAVFGYGATQFAVVGHTVTIDPHSFLMPGMTYTVNLPQGSVLDLAGNSTAAQSVSFTTVKPVTAGTDGNDYLIGNGSGLMLNGGAGTDTVYYDQNTYTKYRNADGSFQVRSYYAAGGLGDTLTGVERILFGYEAYAIDIDGVGGQAYRLYQSAFHRTPDSAGLGLWIAAMDHGMGLLDVASSFITSKEFTDTYGAAPTDAAFVTLLYQNVLHRDPEPAGKALWLDFLQHGASRATVLVDFSESAENHANVAQIIGNGFSYTYAG